MIYDGYAHVSAPLFLFEFRSFHEGATGPGPRSLNPPPPQRLVNEAGRPINIQIACAGRGLEQSGASGSQS